MEGEQFLDFCVDRRNNIIWVISKSKLFYVEKNGDGWKAETVNQFKSLKTKRINFRAIDIDQADPDDDCPVLFYNEGQGAQGHIAKLYNGRDGFSLRDLFDMTSPCFKHETAVNGEIKSSYAYIRHMRFHSFNGKKRLIGVGNLGNAGLFFISKYSGENEEITGRMSVEGIQTSIFGEINDFTVTESENGYVLWLAHKDFTISTYSIHETANELSISRLDEENRIIDDLDYTTYSVKMPDQPMCLRSCGSNVFIGLLNGEILKASISISTQNDTEYATISTENVARTYADLMANTSVKLKNCKYDEEEEFSSMMQNYFIMEQD